MKGCNSYGELAKSLGVDAVILVTMLLDFDEDENLVLSSASMHIYGPNPTPKLDKKYIGFNGAGYNEGQLYSQIMVPGQGAAIAINGKAKKEKGPDGKKITVYEGRKFSIDGFDKLAGRLLNASLGWMEINRQAQLDVKNK